MGRVFSWLLLGLLGCSGRSALVAFDGEGGATGIGATTSSTSSTSSTGTGGSGTGGSCAGMALPARSFHLPNQRIGRTPRLVASSLDGSRVTVLTVADQEPPPLDGHPELHQVTFDQGWTTWSETVLGTSRLVGPASGFEAPHQAGDGLTLWMAGFTQATGPQTLFLLEADPFVEAPPSEVLLDFALPANHLTTPVAGTVSVGSFVASTVNVGLVTPTMGTPMVPTTICTSPLVLEGVSDGLAVDGRFLIAAAASPSLACEAPVEVRLFDQSPTGALVEVSRFAPGGVLSHVWLRPRVADGAWLLAVLPAGATISLWAQAVDDAGQATGDPVVVALPPFFQPATLTVASLDDGFAAAWVADDGGETATVGVQTFDADGTPGQDWSFAPAATPRFDEPLSLLAGPDGTSLLVAWSSDTRDFAVDGGSQVYLRRLCR